MPKDVLTNNKGLSLIELILAMALFALIASAIISFVMGAYSANHQSAQLTRATAYLQETQEAVRAISKEAWNYLEPGQYGLIENGGKWELDNNPNIIDDTYTRTITIEEGDPALDPYRRKITTTLDWSVWEDRETQASAAMYLTAWTGQDWTQTDWSGGSGQDIWAVDNMYLVDNGKLDTSVPGQITLARKNPNNYYLDGMLVSSAFGPQNNFNIIKWTEVFPPNCNNCWIRLHIQTALDNGGAPGTWSNWSTIYDTATGELINPDHINDQWIRYQVTIKGTKKRTPVLEDLTINYYEQ